MKIIHPNTGATAEIKTKDIPPGWVEIKPDKPEPKQ